MAYNVNIKRVMKKYNNTLTIKQVETETDNFLKEINNSLLYVVSTRFVIANETISDIVKGRKYELIETESTGYYIIDDTGEETYYHHSVLDVC